MNVTIEKITKRFWWRGVSADVREYVRTCGPCQRANPNNRPPPATLHPVKVPGIFYRWGIDLVGPLKETANGNKYVIVATEYLLIYELNYYKDMRRHLEKCLDDEVISRFPSEGCKSKRIRLRRAVLQS